MASEEEGVYDLGVRWRDLDPKKFLVIGSLVYLTETAIIYPFELIKTRQQVTTTVPKSALKSTIEDFRFAMKSNGVRGLFRGYWWSSTGTIPSQGAYILGYNWMKDVLDDPNARGSSFWVPFVAGGVADFGSNLLYVPVDIVVQRLQLIDSNHKSGWACLKQIHREEGFRGFYKGLGATLARDTPSSAIWWAVYEHLKEYFSDHDPRKYWRKNSTSTPPSSSSLMTDGASPPPASPSNPQNKWLSVVRNDTKPTTATPTPSSPPSPPSVAPSKPPSLGQNHLAQVLAGAIAGVVTTVAVNPIDVVKTRLQTQSSSPSPSSPSTHVRYRNLVHGLVCLVREEGVQAFTKGMVPRLVSIAPLSGVSSLTYELVLKASKKDV